MRMLAVVACAQNVVETPSSPAASTPAVMDCVSIRTERLTMTSVIAARMALSKFSAKAGEAKKRENNQPLIVYKG